MKSSRVLFFSLPAGSVFLVFVGVSFFDPFCFFAKGVAVSFGVWGASFGVSFVFCHRRRGLGDVASGSSVGLLSFGVPRFWGFCFFATGVVASTSFLSVFFDFAPESVSLTC